MANTRPLAEDVYWQRVHRTGEPHRKVSQGLWPALHTANCLGPCLPYPGRTPPQSYTRHHGSTSVRAVFMTHVTKPEPTAPRSHVTQEKEAGSPSGAVLHSLWLQLGKKMFSFPLRKMLPMVTNLTPSTGGDKSPVGVRRRKGLHICEGHRGRQVSAAGSASQPHVTPPTSNGKKSKL